MYRSELKLKNWQRKTFYKCPEYYCQSENRIIVSAGPKHQDRIYFCPDCGIWTQTRTDWNGAISSEKELHWTRDPGEWVKRYVAYHVADWKQTIINKHERMKECEAEIAEEQDFSTIEVVEDNWYDIAERNNK